MFRADESGSSMSNTYDAIVIGGGHNGLGFRGVPRPGWSQDARAGVAWRRRGCGHHRIALARRPAPAGDPAVLRHESDAADDRARPEPGAARLQGSPDGAVLSGVRRGRVADDLRGRPGADLRAARQMVEEGCRGVAQVERVARGHRRRDGPAAHPGSAEHRLAQARRSARPRQAGLEPARYSRCAPPATSPGCSR